MYSNLKSVFYLLGFVSCCTAKDKYVDLTHVLTPDSPYWPAPGSEPFKISPIAEGFRGANWYSSFQFCSPEHIGTHIDAPYHFYQKGWKTDEIPLDRLIAPAVVIDISGKTARNHVAGLKADDIIKWIDKYGHFPNNSVVLVRTGWSQWYYNKSAYFGDAGDDPSKFAFPGIDISAAEIMNGLKVSPGIHVVGVGIDTPSLDLVTEPSFPTHRHLMEENIYGLENLKDLHKLPAKGAEIFVMPIKMKGSGGPTRVIARLPSNSATKNLFSLYILIVSFLLSLYNSF